MSNYDCLYLLCDNSSSTCIFLQFNDFNFADASILKNECY